MLELRWDANQTVDCQETQIKFGVRDMKFASRSGPENVHNPEILHGTRRHLSPP